MAKVDAQPPFEAYRGTDPYIFVSYSHRDARAVFAELSRLSLWGLNIWYDEGIDPGNEWPKEIAAAIGRSSLFLYFVSPRSVGSVNCRNEVYYALSLKKHFLCIHLEQTNIQEIDAGLALSIGTLQAVMKHSMTEVIYETKLRRALELLCESKISLPDQASTTPIPVQAPPVPHPVEPAAPVHIGVNRPKTSSGSQAIFLIAGIVAVLVIGVAAAGGAFYLSQKQPKTDTSSVNISDLGSHLTDQNSSNSTASPLSSATSSTSSTSQLGASDANPFAATTPQPVNAVPTPKEETPAPPLDNSPPPLLPPPPPGGGLPGLAERIREARRERRQDSGTNSNSNDGPLPPPAPVHMFGQ